MNRQALINQVKSKIDELSVEDAILVDVGLTDEKPIDDMIESLLDESAKEILLKAPIHKLTPTVCAFTAQPDTPDLFTYDVDTHFPLEEGYYTSAQARAIVPANIRKVGLVITYEREVPGTPGTYEQYTEQYIGVGISGWATEGNWTITISLPPAPVAQSYTGIVPVPTDYLRLVEFKMTEWERPVVKETFPEEIMAQKQYNRWLRAGKSKPVLILTHRSTGRVFEYFSVETENTIERYLYIKSDVAENIPVILQDALCWVCASKVLSILNNAAYKTALENAISLL
jgi:hypothetical protein